MVRTGQPSQFQPFAVFAVSAIVGFLASSAIAQAPPSTGVRAASAAEGAQVDAWVPTLRAFSNLVVVDVVVTDSQGNPVHGLKPSDFTLLEDKKEQVISNFEEHSALPASQVKATPAPNLPPGIFTNKEVAPANGAVNVLLLDYLNTPLSAQPVARKQLMDFLDHVSPGTRIAIFALTTRIEMLHGFTADMSTLRDALDVKKGGAPQPSDLMYHEINGAPGGDTSLSSGFSKLGGLGDISLQAANDVRTFEAINHAFELDLRSQYTLNAFGDLARFLVGIPGRKNVIWFSGSFPLDVEPDMSLGNPFFTVVRNDQQVRITDNLLTRAQVAIYPVDARGVMTDPSINASHAFLNPSASSDSPYSSENGGFNDSESDGFDGGNSARTNGFLMQHAQENLTMIQMANDTGGQAFINTNDLKHAIEKAVQNGSNYYTISYSPTNGQWDGRFRAIKLKVSHPGLKLQYRNGYYGIDPNNPKKWIANLAATSGPLPSAMNSAMIHGGPQESEILFKVRIRPADTPPEELPLRSNQVNPDPKVHIEGPYKSYGIDLVPDARAVNCIEDSDGFRHCSLEIWTFVYNSDGQKLVTVSNRVRAIIRPEDYEKMLGTVGHPGSGIAFHQEISVPVRGSYFLRTGIHDLTSDRVGTVEIPVAAVAHLDPLNPLPANPAPAPYSTLIPVKHGSGTAARGANASGDQRSGPTVPISGTVVAPPAPENSGSRLNKRIPEPESSSPQH